MHHMFFADPRRYTQKEGVVSFPVITLFSWYRSDVLQTCLAVIAVIRIQFGYQMEPKPAKNEVGGARGAPAAPLSLASTFSALVLQKDKDGMCQNDTGTAGMCSAGRCGCAGTHFPENFRTQSPFNLDSREIARNEIIQLCPCVP